MFKECVKYQTLCLCWRIKKLKHIQMRYQINKDFLGKYFTSQKKNKIISCISTIIGQLC